MRSLSTLLDPYPLDTFLQEDWNQRSRLLRSSGIRSFQSMFSWETLSYLLTYYPLKYPNLRLAIDERVLDESENAKLREWCQKGATVILNQVHQLLPNLSELAAGLQSDLGWPIQINAYASYPGKQGFSCHYDTHDVLILQVDGTKAWTVLTDSFRAPLKDHHFSTQTPPEGAPVIQDILKPGDVLYIPRGHWHWAIATTEPSLHLTIGIHCRTGIDFLEWWVDRLKHQEDWRRSLPLPVHGAALTEQIQALMNQLQTDRGTAIAAAYQHHLAQTTYSLTPYQFPAQAGFIEFPQGIQTQFSHPAFQTVTISPLPDQTGYTITASGKEVTLRGVPEPAIAQIFTNTRFAGTDLLEWLPDYEWELEIAPLLSRLVQEGLLFVETSLI